MQTHGYLGWAIRNTKTCWWHDSADLVELERGLERGCVGVTTNPYLSNLAVMKNKGAWSAEIQKELGECLNAEGKAEALMRIAVTRVAEKLMPEFERSRGRMGYVCAQVNPSRAGDRECMLAMAKRFHAWSPNIAVKLPATAAGIDVLEECVSQGITITATVSFTLPQLLHIAEKHRSGSERARANGIEPGKCFAVMMIGRLDDYLREVAHDNEAAVSESDIKQAGLAVTKRAYSIYKERGYETLLLVAALRGTHHMTELAGAELIMSIAPAYQEPLLAAELPCEERIDAPVPNDVIDRLAELPEFVRAYEPDGMRPSEFISYGITQRTLSQFCESGWNLLEKLQ
jgi:transaldolase